MHTESEKGQIDQNGLLYAVNLHFYKRLMITPDDTTTTLPVTLRGCTSNYSKD